MSLRRIVLKLYRAPVLDDFNAGEYIELGMGIHNEEGSKRLKTDLPGLVKEMLAQVLDQEDRDLDTTQAAKALESGLHALIAAEHSITKYDTLVGDGDCGLCLKTGAEAILSHLSSGDLATDAAKFVSQVAYVVERSMDGTSGAIYAIFLNALAHHIPLVSGSTPASMTSKLWARALEGALESLGKYTPAQPGDRPLVDALAPFVTGMKDGVKIAVKAAKKGGDTTMGMRPGLGRSVYVGGEEWIKCPDPGALGLVKFLAGLVEGLD